MNLGDIKRRVANALGDDAMLVFEAADLADFANDAQFDIARKTDVLVTTNTLNVVAGTASYPLQTEAIEVMRVSLSGQKLIKTTWQEIDLMDPAAGSTTGVPDHFYVMGRNVYLYPIPSSSASQALVVTYSKIPTLMVNDTDIPEIPPYMHEDICIRVIARGHEQVEDYQASAAKATEYNNAITLSQEQAKEGSDESYPLIRDIDVY